MEKQDIDALKASVTSGVLGLADLHRRAVEDNKIQRAEAIMSIIRVVDGISECIWRKVDEEVHHALRQGKAYIIRNSRLAGPGPGPCDHGCFRQLAIKGQNPYPVDVLYAGHTPIEFEPIPKGPE